MPWRILYCAKICWVMKINSALSPVVFLLIKIQPKKINYILNGHFSVVALLLLLIVKYLWLRFASLILNAPLVHLWLRSIIGWLLQSNTTSFDTTHHWFWCTIIIIFIFSVFLIFFVLFFFCVLFAFDREFPWGLIYISL